MRTHVLSAVVIGALLSPVAVQAQDPVKVDPTHYKVVFENASVRVLKISYPVGGKSVPHAHPDAMVVALGPSTVQMAMADGKIEKSDLARESAMFTPAGTHTPTNVGKTPVDALLIEFKTAAPGKATIPTSRENMTIKVLADSPRAVAYRVTATPSFSEPAGTKHEYDQIVISLGDSKMSLSIDGKPPKASWSRGDAVFIGRGVAHESKNGNSAPVDFIIVAIR